MLRQLRNLVLSLFAFVFHRDRAAPELTGAMLDPEVQPVDDEGATLGWSLHPVRVQGPLRVLEVWDPSVSSTDVKMPETLHDVC